MLLAAVSGEEGGRDVDDDFGDEDVDRGRGVLVKGLCPGKKMATDPSLCMLTILRDLY